MDSPTLLLIGATNTERDQVEGALRRAGMPATIERRSEPETGSRLEPAPAAAIICGVDPEGTLRSLSAAGNSAPVVVLERSVDAARRNRLRRRGVRAIVGPGRVASLARVLNRELGKGRDAARPGTVGEAVSPYTTLQARQLLDAAFEAIQDVILVWELRSGRIVTCNEAVRSVFGYEPEELVGGTTKKLFPDREAFDDFNEFLSESLERWGRFSADFEFVRRDGRGFEAAVQIASLPPGLGMDACVVGTIRDTSQVRQAERAVSETMEHLKGTLDSLQDAVITADPATRTILTCNPAVEAIFGYSPRELIGHGTEAFFPDRDTYEAVGREYAQALEERGVYRRELTIPHKDGYPINVEVTISALSASLGWREGIVASFRNVTEQKRAEERARLAESVLRNTVEGVMITDVNRRIIAVNPAFERLTGYTAAEIMGRKPDILRSGQHDQAFYDRIQTDVDTKGFWQGEMWHRRKGGQVFPSMASSSAIRDEHGKVTHYAGVFTDISHHKHVQERLEYLVRYDPLTGLPNRATFEYLIGQVIKRTPLNRSRAAVLFLDIDHFKTVNETLGHGAGDQLLRDMSERLRRSLRPGDELARLGGDEFGIILRELNDPRDAASVARHLMDQLDEPFQLEGREIYASASIGVSILPDDGSDTRTLMKNADSALFRAKEHGRNSYEFFSKEMNIKAFETLVIVNSLRQGLERDEFELHYQPRIDARSGVITGVEALIRWNHPDLGLTMPNQFISLAEQTGLIGSLGNWVMKTAFSRMKEWQSQGLRLPTVSLNLSTREFAAPELARNLSDMLEDSGLDSSLVELEITESMLMSDPGRVESTLRELKTNNVRVVIDDFGTGYSSLNYLKHFPISGLKIDQSFVRGIPGDPDDLAITRAIIAMAQSLNLRLIAEGVETEEQAAFLREHGCHELQGFLFSPPVTVDAFTELLRRNPTHMRASD